MNIPMKIKLTLMQTKNRILPLILLSIPVIYFYSQQTNNVNITQEEQFELTSSSGIELENTKKVEWDELNVKKQVEPISNRLFEFNSKKEFYQLIEQNPAKAAVLIVQIETPREFSLVISLLNNWSQTDPEAALSWFVSLEDTVSTEQYQIGLRAILRKYVKQQPIYTFEQYRTLLDERYWDEFVFDTASAIALDDPTLALSWIDSLHTEGISNEAIDDAYIVIMARLINIQPLDAIEMLNVVKSKEIKYKLVPSLATALARTDLDLALTWLNEIPSPIEQQVALASIVEQVILNDEAQAIELFRQFSHLQFDNGQIFERTLNKIALKNSTYLMEYITEIPVQLQSELAAAVVRAGINQGVPDSKNIQWLKQLPTSSLAFQGGAKVLAKLFITEKPISALYWASLLTEPNERKLMLRRILHLAPLSQLDPLASEIQNLYISGEEQEQLQILLSKRIEKLNIG